MKPLRFCGIGAHRVVEERGWNVVKNSSHGVILFVCVNGRKTYKIIELAIFIYAIYRKIFLRFDLIIYKIGFKLALPLFDLNVVESEIGCNISLL